MSQSFHPGAWLSGAVLLFSAFTAQAQENASCASGANLTGNRSYQVQLPTYDGQSVSFQVMEPASFDCANLAKGAHPLMLHGPGYSGSRSTSGFDDYRSAGYTVISWDPRGFGDTSGSVRVMDPEFEGQYYVQILDWAEQNLDYLAWRDEATGNFVARPASASSVAGGVNLVVGAQGSSYGGGYQMMLLTVDHKKRLDAIAPDITWHDLRDALNPGDAVKTLWDLALTALGEGVGHSSAGAPTEDGQDPFIKETLARGSAFNEWPRQSLDWFHYRGLGYWCAANGLPAMPYPAYGADTVPMVDAVGSYNVPERTADGRPGLGDFLVPVVNPAAHFKGLQVLITQGMIDTLFNFNHAWWNRQCLAAAGASVSLYTHNSGHAIPGAQAPDEVPADTGSCALDKKLWFDSHLRPGSAPVQLAETCFALGADEDTVNLPAQDVLAPLTAAASGNFTVLPLEGPLPAPAGAVLVPSGVDGAVHVSGNAPIAASLGVAAAEGVLAGVPHLKVTVSSPAGVNETAAGPDCRLASFPLRTGCDSIVFVGLGRKAGASPVFSLIDDQLTALRGLGEFDVDLVGVAERVNAGDELAVLFFATHPQFFSAYSRDTSLPLVQVAGTVSLPLYAAAADGSPQMGAEGVLPGGAPAATDEGAKSQRFGGALGLGLLGLLLSAAGLRRAQAKKG